MSDTPKPKRILANPYTQSHNPTDKLPVTFLPPVNKPVRSEDFPHIEQRPLLRDTIQPTPPSISTESTSVKSVKRSRDIALTCRNKYCKQTTATHNVHYVYAHNTVTHDSPKHCPMCAAHDEWITTRSFDYADTLCIKFPMLPRPLASALVDNYNNTLNATRSRTHTLTVDGITVSSISTVNVPCQFKSVEDMITEVLPAKLTTSSSITPIHVKCNDCLSTVTILRTNPTPASMPKFCIWCSSTNLSITLPSTDETATLVLNLDLIEQQFVQELATKYNIPLLVMQALYDQWSSQSKVRTIADWMQTPAVQKVIKLINSRSTV